MAGYAANSSLEMHVAYVVCN